MHRKDDFAGAQVVHVEVDLGTVGPLARLQDALKVARARRELGKVGLLRTEAAVFVSASSHPEHPERPGRGVVQAEQHRMFGAGNGTRQFLIGLGDLQGGDGRRGPEGGSRHAEQREAGRGQDPG